MCFYVKATNISHTSYLVSKYERIMFLIMRVILGFCPCVLLAFMFVFLEYNVAVFVTNQMTADPGAGMT